MFPSQTGLFLKITCPSIELKARCEMLNCVFAHPEEEAKRKQIQSSFSKASYADRYQAFINPNTLDKRHRHSEKHRTSSGSLVHRDSYHETPQGSFVVDNLGPPSIEEPKQIVSASSNSNQNYINTSNEPEDPYTKRLKLSLNLNGEGLDDLSDLFGKEEDEEEKFNHASSPKLKVTSTNLLPLKQKREFGKQRSQGNSVSNVQSHNRSPSPGTKPEYDQLSPSNLNNTPISISAQNRQAPFEKEEVSSRYSQPNREMLKSVETKPSQSVVSKRIIGGTNAKPLAATAGRKRLLGNNQLQEEQKKNDPVDLQNIEEDIELFRKPVVPFSPAQTNVRQRYLSLLQHLFRTLDLKFPNRDAVLKEYEIASTATNRTYETIIKRTIYQMANPEIAAAKVTVPKDDQTDRKTIKLNSLICDKRKLAQYGYITEIPQIQADFEPVKITKCDRCGLEFDISKIFKRTKCLFHPERFSLSRHSIASHASNDINSKFYPCCNQPVGESEGCKRSRYHVYKLNTPEELQHEIPFISTEEFTKTPETLKAIALDCEMGYTTKGFELIRITMLDFFTEQTVYDKKIKPEGRIVDLNTYWSGVLVIDEENSPSFNDFLQEIALYIDKDTILIGHSLENDLNVMRLIHHKVIDTSIIFTNGLKKRSLKDVTFEFLSKKIQTGEHDSEEDARSCIGLVKWQIDQLMKMN